MYHSNLLDFCQAPRPDVSQGAEIIELFAGGGGWAAGFEMAGFKSRIAVERDPDNEVLSAKLAECHKENFPHCTIIMRTVQEMEKLNWIGLPKGKILIASPVCSNFSSEKNKGKEEESDITAAIAVSSAISCLAPSIFVLEQVPLYENSQSWAIIQEALKDYQVSLQVVDMKDWGIPQLSRRRMIVVASREKQFTFPSPPNTCLSWWDAIAGLELMDSQLLLKQQQASEEYKGQEPLLIERVGNRGECKVYPGKGYAPTLKKSIFTDGKGSNRLSVFDILLSNKEAKQLSMRAAARIQGFPDWWNPSCPAAIGYAVPPFFAYQLFLEIQNQLTN